MLATIVPLIGVFETQDQAEHVVALLEEAGIKGVSITSSLDAPLEGVASEEISSAETIDALISWGLTSDEAHYYVQQYTAGHPIVLIQPDESLRQTARDILYRHGANVYEALDMGQVHASEIEMQEDVLALAGIL